MIKGLSILLMYGSLGFKEPSALRAGTAGDFTMATATIPSRSPALTRSVFVRFMLMLMPTFNRSLIVWSKLNLTLPRLNPLPITTPVWPK